MPSGNISDISDKATACVAELLHLRLGLKYVLVNLIIYIFKYSLYVCKHLPGTYQIFLTKLPPHQDMAPKIKLRLYIRTYRNVISACIGTCLVTCTVSCK